MGNCWTGNFVCNIANSKADLQHNFFLVGGARANKIRTCETVTGRCARSMIGHLLVRGGLHIVAYTKASRS